MGITESVLKRQTKKYWRDYEHKNPKPHLERYIEELLPREMEYAKQHGRLPSDSYDMLVLLVGFSVEPLLQTVYAYKPCRILLVLNERYGLDKPGSNWGRMVKDLICVLPDPPREVELAIVQAGPQQVFKALLDNVRQTKDVVVDITGAKKNMVAGAFLFAALANVPVSYVDFDDDAYDPKEGKPYGYGCDIGILDNPYEKFALRDWGRVRELYSRYKFRDARRLLMGEDGDESGTVLATMKEYLPDSERHIHTLGEILRCYELWDAGLYNEAATQAKKISGFAPPTAVKQLDGKWFQTEQAQFKGGWEHLDIADFRAYVYDELSRIKRLINFNRDYRSAFLRSGSLNEVIMTVRMITLRELDERKQVLVKVDEKGIPLAKWLFERFVTGQPFRWQGIEFSLAGPMKNWWTQLEGNWFSTREGWKDLIHRRNDLAHQYYSPPPEWAEDALKFVKANVEDFWGTDAGKEINTQVWCWSKVCEFTGLRKYLPPNLLKDINDQERSDCYDAVSVSG